MRTFRRRIPALLALVAAASACAAGTSTDEGTGEGSGPDASVPLADGGRERDAAPAAGEDAGHPVDATAAPPDGAAVPPDAGSPAADASSVPPDGSLAPQDSGADAEIDADTDASVPPVDAGDDSGIVTFGGSCNGAHTTLTGTTLAPNGIDPIPHVRAYAAIQINPYPAGYCDKCSAPLDPAYASAVSAADGTFSLDLDNVPYGATIDFAVQIGRFRKHTSIPVTACAAGTVPAAAATLPGSSAAGDIPKIAVSAGNQDHLDAILAALGITEYDCYEGRKNGGSSTATCPLVAGKNIADVMSSPATLGTYEMVFLSCAPGAYAHYATTYSTSTITQNTAAWVGAGGRMFATDTAYDWIEQPFPDAITFAGPTAAAGTPQPVDGANVGCSSGSTTAYAANVDDAALAAWLKIVGFPQSPSVQIQGFIQPWSAMTQLASTSERIADGTFSSNPSVCSSSADIPLTTQFDVGSCGRVAYSSYHTLPSVNASNLAAQEKIMEFLIFGVAGCRN
jgi:hypothetical protein